MSGRSTPFIFIRNAQGVAAVEFAIVANVFIAFVIGIACVAIMLFNNMSLHWAVEKAARTAAINGAITQSQIADEVNSYLSSLGLSNAAVTYTVAKPNNVAIGTITASYSQSYTIPFVRTFNITFSSDTSVPIGN
jgi:Flp pilus assembly protein TadG